MIKVMSMTLDAATMTATVELVSDTKAEVWDENFDLEVPEIPEGYKVGLGSTVITAEGDLGIRKSNETWSWIGG